MTNTLCVRRFTLAALSVCIAVCAGAQPTSTLDLPPLYKIDVSVVSRSISWENPTGAPGEGGQTSSPLGIGRKGAPQSFILPDTTVTLAEIDGPGTIRHIWMTGSPHRHPSQLRSTIVRAYWDGQEHPSIECPLGDWMGIAHCNVAPYQSAVHSVGDNAALNLWLPMPFTRNARITISNDGPTSLGLYYQVDYTLGERHAKNVGRLHTLFRRENPTTLTQDFELLPKRTGAGRFVGCLMGVRSLDTKRWWGEGEIKFFMDGDSEFPTICGTGAEDYVCQSYGVQERPYLYHGTALNQDGFITMYRWHLPDPVYWKKSCRVTIQQIGIQKGGLYERSDDWSCATFWYENIPSAPLPALPPREARLADISIHKPPPKASDAATTRSTGSTAAGVSSGSLHLESTGTVAAVRHRLGNALVVLAPRTTARPGGTLAF
ncbi:MAG: glycoside hydrolase family 172 protein [Candidatus Sumerlaeaceae bacterium]